jgi:enoyl-CoA hydratase
VRVTGSRRRLPLSTDGPIVRTTRSGRVLLVTIDNPPHGLMDTTVVHGLASVVSRVGGDASLGGVVLTGAHPSRFVAHYDVAELLKHGESGPQWPPRTTRTVLRATRRARRWSPADRFLRYTPLAGAAMLDHLHEVLFGIEQSPAVWIAALNGSALGAGCELALACDLRVMAAGDFVIGQPEILLGLLPGGGGTQRLARLVGQSRASRLILEGRQLVPEAAAEIGLVDSVIDPDALLDTAQAEVVRIAERPKAAIGACKRAMAGASANDGEGFLVERAEFLAALGSLDTQSAMRSYVEATERTCDLPAYSLTTPSGTTGRADMAERVGTAVGGGFS